MISNKFAKYDDQNSKVPSRACPDKSGGFRGETNWHSWKTEQVSLQKHTDLAKQ